METTSLSGYARRSGTRKTLIGILDKHDILLGRRIELEDLRGPDQIMVLVVFMQLHVQGLANADSQICVSVYEVASMTSPLKF